MEDTTLRLNRQARENKILIKNEKMVKESNITKPPEWKNREYSSMKEMNGEENDNFSHEWIWNPPYEEGLNGVDGKINNEKNKLDVGLWKTSQNYEVTYCH